MALTQCPECGESERLSGQQAGETISLRCAACGASWERETTRRCRNCDSDDLRYTPKPLWEKGRGEQRTPAGRIDAYACNACGEADVVASIGEHR
ncbi:MAG: hypothetical protein V3R84_08745 [Acidimicrobiia bacterium]